MSDIYAMGVTECDNMLMLMGVSTKMSEKERDVVMPLMMRGFKVFHLLKAIFLQIVDDNNLKSYRIVLLKLGPM